jgi:hypothetical protein
MQVLLIRHDKDGSSFYRSYGRDLYGMSMLENDIAAHLNTAGVVRLELILTDEMGRPPSTELPVMETLAKEMFPAEYAAIDDDHPMDEDKVRMVQNELIRRHRER